MAVAKVFSEHRQQVVDLAEAYFSNIIVANVITYETCQELDLASFQTFAADPADFCKSRATVPHGRQSSNEGQTSGFVREG